MTDITILFDPWYERLAEEVIDEIENSAFDAVLVGLPEDLETTVRAHVGGRIREETVWKEYQIITGLHERFIKPVRRRIHPLLRYLTRRVLARALMFPQGQTDCPEEFLRY